MTEEERRAYNRAYRRANPTYNANWLKSHPNYGKEYYKANRNRLLGQSKAWAMGNRMRKRQINKEYIERNPWTRSLSNARQWCENPKDPSYKWYGGRGIKCFLSYADVRSLWQKHNASNMNNPTLLRIDPKGHYLPENCTFIDRSNKVNALSHRRGNSKINI